MDVKIDRFKYLLFGFVYFVQGASLAYLGNFQKPYLNQQNIGPAAIASLTSLLLIPFIAKIFLGYLSDRYNFFGLGHRKPYMLLGILLSALAFLAVAQVSPKENFSLYSILIFIAISGIALFDTSTDGLAVDIGSNETAGKIQSYMIGGKSFGFILLSFGFGYLVQDFGYAIVFYILVALMIAAGFWILCLSLPPHTKPSLNLVKAYKSFTKPIFTLAAFAIFYSITSFGVDGLISYYLSKEFQASELLIGTYGSYRGLGALLGAIAAGVLYHKLQFSSLCKLALISLLPASILLAFTNTIDQVLILAPIWGAAWAFQEVSFVTIAMRLIPKGVAATLFAIMMMFSNIGTMLGEFLATSLVAKTPFSQVFLLLPIFLLPAYLILQKLLQQKQLS